MKTKYFVALITALVIGGGLAIAYVFAILTNVDPKIYTSSASSSEIVLPPNSDQIEARLNEFRKQKGLAVFNTEVPALDKAAQARADDMCATNDWSHAKDWQVLDQYYSYSYAGENLYYGSLQKNQVSDAITTWANSPSHLENMVADYAQVGIGVKACPGFQGSDDAVIITNYFGVPR